MECLHTLDAANESIYFTKHAKTLRGEGGFLVTAHARKNLFMCICALYILLYIYILSVCVRAWQQACKGYLQQVAGGTPVMWLKEGSMKHLHSISVSR